MFNKITSIPYLFCKEKLFIRQQLMILSTRKQSQVQINLGS